MKPVPKFEIDRKPRIPSTYQLSSRDLMNSRIQSLVNKHCKKYELILNYIKRMQDFDAIFTKIKLAECNNNIDEVISTMDRMEDKSNELFIRKTNLDTEIHEVQKRIDQSQGFILNRLESNSFAVGRTLEAPLPVSTELPMKEVLEK